MQEGLMSVTQAAQELNLGRSQILRLCNSGRFPNAQKIGNNWVIPKEDIESYKPGEKGFAAVWKKRRSGAAMSDDEIKQALKAAADSKKEAQEV